MANYNQISYGSTGSDVEELQKLLNQNGYNLEQDGSFGPKTQAAVKDYQNKKGLKVDGIVGTNTWGALTKNQADSSNSSGSNSAASTAPGYSDAVNRAYEMLNQNLSQKPGDYQNQWQNQLDDTLNKILNREKFSYDLNGDALYQQYKDQYIQNGKMAMMDTMGQAQAITGGYGNSYAQSVGQQAYQGYLQQLNDKVPELYQLAYDQYNQEGQDLYNQYALLNSQNEQEYSKYRDAMSDWQTDRDYLTGRYDTALGYQYQNERDKVADAQWQKEFDEAKRQYDLSYALSVSKGSDSDNSNIDNPSDEPVSDYNLVETDNTKMFRASVMTRREFSRRGGQATVNGKTVTNYNDYIKECLKNWTDNGIPNSGGKTLSDDEVATLMAYYGM